MAESIMLQEKCRIRHHECGANARIKLQVLLDYFQDIAARHADALGFGLRDLQKTQTLWVLSRLKIAITEYPKLDDEILLTTYPAGCDKIFAMRHYTMARGNQILLTASSAWLVLDAQSLRPQLPNRALPEALPENPELPRFFPHLGKLPEPAFSPCSTYEVESSDIDLNGHLNNAIYARYIENVLGKLAPQRDIAELQINFLRAAPLHTILPCGGEIHPDGTFQISGGEPLNFSASGVLRAKSGADF